MKNLILITLITCLSVKIFAQAPPPPPDEDKIDVYRVAFITQFLDLTSDEAQKFWPIYNQMRDEIKSANDKLMDMTKNKKPENMSDAELNELIKTQIDTDQKMVDIKRKYAEEFKKALPLQKVAKLAIAENEFKRRLLEIMRDRPGDGPGSGKNRPGGN